MRGEEEDSLIVELKNYCWGGGGGGELQTGEKGGTVKEKKRKGDREGRDRGEKGGQREEGREKGARGEIRWKEEICTNKVDRNGEGERFERG